MDQHPTIVVSYEHKSGLHVFRSADMPGLMVAHANFAIAFNDVPKVIAKLYKLNAEMDVKVTPDAFLFKVTPR